MSYNPTRMKPGQIAAKRQRRLDPRAGTRLSDIVSRQGPRSTAPGNLNGRKETDRGWMIEYFKNDNFEASFQYWAANNTTGAIWHTSKDRVVKVLYGRFCVTIYDEKTKSVESQDVLGEGHVFIAKKGICYELATYGDSDTELLFIQDRDYESGLEQITEAFLNNQTKSVLTTPERNAPPARLDNSKAMQQAQMMQYQRQMRQRQLGKSTRVDNPNMGAVLARTKGQQTSELLPGQTVTGVNPQPMGMRSALDGNEG